MFDWRWGSDSEGSFGSQFYTHYLSALKWTVRLGVVNELTREPSPSPGRHHCQLSEMLRECAQ
jgi:hypothetical protein